MLERSRLLRRSFPGHSLDLLLKAGLAAEEQAVRAWAEWNRIQDFETLSWPERQLFSAFAKRIGELDPTSPLRPRIDGLAKNLWAATELALGRAVGGLQHVAQAGIPFILLKSSVLHAEKLTPAWQPPTGEAAILVHPEAVQRAAGALAAEGWVPPSADPAGRRLLARGYGLAFRNGRNGRIDPYVGALRGVGPRSGDASDAIWRRARPATLRSLPVLIPDPADAILVDLTCAPLGSTAEWALRIHARIAHQAVDWDRLTEAAGRHGLVLTCLAGLYYLRDGLGVAVPDPVLATLGRAPLNARAWLSYLANQRDPADRRLLPRAVGFAASRLLHRQGR